VIHSLVEVLGKEEAPSIQQGDLTQAPIDNQLVRESKPSLEIRDWISSLDDSFLIS
jgi:hypothetical protein